LQAAIVGGGLAIAGAALQGVFRNPLADPGIIGVSAGASLGAVGALVSGVAIFGRFTTPAFAFLAGMLTAVLVYSLARFQGRTEVVTLILTGVAINAIAGALTGLIITIADDAELRSITFWSLGSVGGATWSSVGSMAPFAILGFLLLPRWGGALNLFVLGEKEARHLGVATEKVRIGVLLLAALVTGATVAFTGIINFVGLVVPHAIRLAVGPDHRVLLPASALAGASLLVLTDLLARTIASPIEVPLGVVTALLGGPAFLLLLGRTRRQAGGWG
jgi:iron complex transport system permease protein